MTPRAAAHPRHALIAALALVGACAGPAAPAGPTPATAVATPAAPAPDQAALDALARADFAAAGQAADQILVADPRAARAAAVRAISRYQAAGVALFGELEALGERFEHRQVTDDELRAVFLRADAALAAVDADLAIAEADPGFALELCLACWSYDWNLDRRIDERDERLFEIEHDLRGVELPAGDARRRPTFRLDVGDVTWARAMLAFQRALLHLGAAYRWAALPGQVDRPDRKIIRVPLGHPEDVTQARDLILAGLDLADRCREAYLAETDDDREWVPNPRQRSYPVPLGVDQALYDTWQGVIGDLRRLVKSEQGLAIGELLGLIPGATPPAGLGYLDVGKIFSEPRDVVIDGAAIDALEDVPADSARHARALFGALWRSEMPASPLIARLRAARDSLMRGDDQVERKLRYLFWLN